MAELLIGAFSDRKQADGAVNQLRESGYNVDDISVITRQDTVIREQQNEKKETDDGAPITSGAVTGGTLGGVTGLLLGVAGIIIIGPISALLGLGGIVGTTVTGLVMGAVAGGLVGALTKLGVPEEQAREYDRVVQEGGVVLAAPVKKLTIENIRRIFEDNGAEGTSEVETKA